ncbi:MAG TPA: cell envelope biogenesis protein OmpA [Pricia sp.]|nr:cell envelope biogenesis protein OmpA [Pricia sp.]
MKYPLTYNVIFGCALIGFISLASAQDTYRNDSDTGTAQTEKRMDDYRSLKSMGYEDQAIYEDLGNANFLNEDYETALFWYEKLKDNSTNGTLSSSYYKRYQHAMQQTVADNSSRASDAKKSDNKDWLEMIRSDYQIDGRQMADASVEAPSKFRKLNLNRTSDLKFVENQLLSDVDTEISDEDSDEVQNLYRAPIALTSDGRTAYFSKPEYVKPLYGVLSKKELVHKMYRAEKINGQWKNAREVAVAPVHASAMHPALSEDGKRLFFASNMPGSFGDYDIYVASVNSDGSLGIAKNLGRKVNTKKNDMYPNVIQGNTLSFASEGHRGQGGLDVYMAQVGRANVSLAINLGSEINSEGDEFAVAMNVRSGKGYVMSNREGSKADVQKVAFSYGDDNGDKFKDNILEALNDSQIDYTSSLFEDE